MDLFTVRSKRCFIHSVRYFHLSPEESTEEIQTAAYFHLQFPEYLEQVQYIEKLFDKMQH